MSDHDPPAPSPDEPVLGDLPPPGDDPTAWAPPNQPGSAWPSSDPSTWPPPSPPAGGAPPVIEAGYGPGAGGPPPGGNRGLKVTLILMGIVVVLGGVLAAGVIAWNAVSDSVAGDPTPTPTPTSGETDEAPADRDDPSDVALDEVLTLIDESEQTMIQFQIAVEQAVSDEAVRDAGSTAATDLRRIDDELTETELTGSYSEAVQAVRDSYLEHLRAWSTYAEATADDAEAFLDQSGEYWEDITDTADVFVAAMEDDLPDDIPDDLARYADFILDRGFRDTGGGDGGTLV